MRSAINKSASQDKQNQITKNINYDQNTRVS